MIYAIRALGAGYVKIGKADKPMQRLKDLQCANPFELKLAAFADWPDVEERRIHKYLKAKRCHARNEWFSESPYLELVIDALLDGEIWSWHRVIGINTDRRPYDSYRKALKDASEVQSRGHRLARALAARPEQIACLAGDQSTGDPEAIPVR